MSTDTTTVKAWLYTKTSYPSTLHSGTTTIPNNPPTPTSLIIAPHAVSLNPVDIQLMNLAYNNSSPSHPLYGSFVGPKIAGRDFSGTVIAAGPQTPFSPGDTIMGINMGIPGTGFLSERVALDLKPGSGATVIRKPPNLSFIEAASLPCVWLTAKTSIDRCTPYMTNREPYANKLVVLGGSSSTGIYTIRLAKRHGWTVLSSCSSRNTSFVESLGADVVVDYTTSPTAVVSAVKAFGPDAIVDCVGGTDTVGLAPQYVTIVGDKTSRDTMGGSFLYWTHPRMLWRWFLGYLGWGNGYECIVLESRGEWLEEVAGLKGGEIEKGGEVLVDSVFGFGEVKEAFERLDTGRARGKVVVRIVDG